jgi:cysteine synthase
MTRWPGRRAAPDRVQNADLIVAALPTDGTSSPVAAIVRVAQERVHLVLIVPSTNGISARRLS